VTWDPESGESPNREHRMVDEGVWRWYHKRRSELYAEWSSGRFARERWQGEPDDHVTLCLRAGMDELRAHVRRLAKDFPGIYLVPV
jgi:hypothetical protein